MRIPPCWQIVPPSWTADLGRDHALRLEPGPGWGTGLHETTQLCLQAIAYARAQRGPGPFRMLDFGSGSGLLGIAAAKLGGTVDAVEIDLEATQHARRNVALNDVAVRFATDLRELDPGPRYDLVVANVFNIVLVDLAPAFAGALAPGGALVLSGLVGTDGPNVGARYAALLGGREPTVARRGDWCALAWL